MGSLKGPSACLEISRRANEIAAENGGKVTMVKEAMELATAVANPLAGIIQGLKSKNEAKQKLANMLRVDISSMDSLQSNQKCTQGFSGGQSNVIDMRGCAEVCKLHPGGCKLDNVTQSNTLNVEFACAMHGIMEVLSTQAASVDNAAVLTLMQNAKGIMAGNDTSADMCNDVKTGMSTSKYVKSTQICANKAALPQSNLIACAGMINVEQNNSSNLYGNCMAMETKKVTTRQKQNVKNSTETNTKQAATGISAIALIVMALVVAFAVYKVSENKPVAIGIGIIIVVLACLAVFALLMENKQKGGKRKTDRL